MVMRRAHNKNQGQQMDTKGKEIGAEQDTDRKTTKLQETAPISAIANIYNQMCVVIYII